MDPFRRRPPDGSHRWELHHICLNRSCVNPDHIQLVTHREHARISDAIGIRAAIRFPSKPPNSFAPHPAGIVQIRPGACLSGRPHGSQVLHQAAQSRTLPLDQLASDSFLQRCGVPELQAPASRSLSPQPRANKQACAIRRLEASFQCHADDYRGVERVVRPLPHRVHWIGG